MVSIDESILSLITKWNGYGLALYTVITILMTGILSSTIGLERELKGQAAGLRTHVIVSIGCCLLMVLSIFGMQVALKGSQSDSQGAYNINLDVSRIAAGILSGIGFMGAGAIVKNGLSIRGLTTASTLWLVSAIGMACGCGFIFEAFLVTVIALFFLIGFSKVEKLLDKGSPQVHLVVAPNVPILHEVRNQAEKYRLIVKNIVTENTKGENGRDQVDVVIYFAFHSPEAVIENYVESFASYPYIYKAEIKRDKKHRKEQED